MKLSKNILTSLLLVTVAYTSAIASEMPNSYDYISEVVKVTKSVPITIIEKQDIITEQCTTNRVLMGGGTHVEYKTVHEGSVIGGLATGAGLGSIVHNNVGGGSGKKWATGAAAILGYGVGNQAFGTDKTYQRTVQNPSYYADQINCENVVTGQEKVKVVKYKNSGKTQNGKIVSSITDFTESTIDVTEHYDGPGY